MLRVRPKGQKTEVVFYRRTSRFSPDFLKGLVWAVAFHLFLLLCLRISCPKPPDESHLLPFSEVEAEYGAKAWVAQVMAFDPYVATLELSPQMMPDLLPSMAPPLIQHELLPDFSSLEKIPFHPLHDEGEL